MRRRTSDEDKQEYLDRIVSLEKHIVLPARIALVVSCVVFLWPLIVAKIGGEGFAVSPDHPSAAMVGVFKWAAAGYALLSIAYWVYLLALRAKVTSLVVTKTVVFCSALTDNVFLGLLVNAAMVGTSAEEYFLGAGPEASLFWAYCAFMVRNTFLFTQLLLAVPLGILYVAGYVGAVLLNIVGLQGRALSEAEEGLLIFRVLVLGLIMTCSTALYNLWRRRRRELDEAHERAIRSQRLDMAGMLAAQVAHELKNPLSVMTNAAYLMRRSKEPLDGNLRKHVDIIEEEIRRADHIIRQLLDYAKLAEGKIEAVVVNDCVDESLAGLKHEIESRSIEVEKNYSFDLPFLLIDSGQLRQVLSNILLNASEAMGNGGKITVSTSYSLDGFIEVSITDTGKGMDAEVLSNVFKAFFTTKEKGTGMGLSIVQNVVRAYNGQITADSEPGKRTAFHLRFPTRMARRLNDARTQARLPQSAMTAAIRRAAP